MEANIDAVTPVNQDNQEEAAASREAKEETTLPKGAWICCETVQESTRRRCSRCRGWKRGRRSLLKRPKSKKKMKADSTNPQPRPITKRKSPNTPSIAGDVIINGDKTAVSPMTMAGSTGVNTNVSIQSDPTDLSTILDNEALIDELMKHDLTKWGNGFESDEEGTGYNVKNDLSQAAADSAFDQMINDRLQLEDNVLDDEDNLHMCVGSPDDIEPCQLEGAPPGWFPPGPKEGWQYKQKTAKNEPHFSTVDNPGGWSPFTFRPHFAERYQTGTYKHHVTAGGAIPVPINEETGKRTSGNWEFFYNGWKQEDPNPNYVRTGANKDTVFPPDRKAKLDGELLKKMGLTRERMIEGDVLFFIN